MFCLTYINPEILAPKTKRGKKAIEEEEEEIEETVEADEEEPKEEEKQVKFSFIDDKMYS